MIKAAYIEILIIRFKYELTIEKTSMLNRYLLFFSLFLILFITIEGFAQDEEMRKQQAKAFVEMADEIYKANLGLDMAREQYEQAAQLDPENLHANYMAGDLYIQRGPQKERSTEYLLKVYQIDPNYRFDILYKIGQGYQYGLSFDEAISYYNQYKEKLESNAAYRGEDKIPLGDVNRRIQECNNGKVFVQNPEEYTIVNIGGQMNSNAHDFAPVLNEDETMLIFTSRRQDGNLNENVDNDNFYFEDIFISRKNNDQWGAAENIGEIVNTPNHDSNLALSADGKSLYIYRDDNGGDIYFSDQNKDGTWTEPMPVGGNINSSYYENAVTISPDRKILLFSSDRPSGKGGLDIYMSIKDSRGEWGKVTNLSSVVNTAYDEDGPFLDYDGKTLYFSSRGHDGMGGYDIFKTEYDSANETWTTPVNLGYPINTPDDDVYFVSTKDGKRGYYSSVKDDGQGYTDIYMISLPDLSDRTPEKIQAQKNKLNQETPKKTEIAKVAEKETEPATEKNEVALTPVTLLLKVEDQQDGSPLDANVQMQTFNGNRQINVQQVEAGLYKMEILIESDEDFMLSAEKSGYVFKNFKLKIPAAKEEPQLLKRRFELQRFEVGAHDVLRNIYFDFGTASFKQESFTELGKLEKMLVENPQFTIEIAGHTDKIGSSDFNLSLSRNRALAVVKYLTGKGIRKERLKAEGYGETKPMATNDDELEGRSLNRRVEFHVLKRNF